ncbi:hypothetical protein PPYC1_14685 [Paenibacillus polymyxa]|nr:hypothetical protein PPYC1_14685 [Paenibacillus polymyxa]
MVLKFSEEVRETSQAMLSYVNASGSEYKQLSISDVKEECADVVLVALSLFYKLSSNEEELQEFLNKKVNKWESVMT